MKHSLLFALLAGCTTVTLVSCGGDSGLGPYVAPPVVPKVPCKLGVSTKLVTVTNVAGGLFDVSLTDCTQAELSGPSLPAPLVLTSTRSVSILPSATSGPIAIRATGTNGTVALDTVWVQFLRPPVAQIVMPLPATAPANAVVPLRVLRGGGTICGVNPSLNYPLYGTGSIYPSGAANAADPMQIDVRMPSYVDPAGERFILVCRGEDATFHYDTLNVKVTFPSLTAVDSIIPRTAVVGEMTTYRVYAHGCPFASNIGFRGIDGFVPGTLEIIGPLTPPIQESIYVPIDGIEGCNVAIFHWGVSGPAGTKLYFHLRNPGQPPVTVSVTLVP